MILVVEDEGRRLENDIDELCSRGYQVRIEETVDGAIRFLQHNRDDVDGVICDIMMPHGSHFSAAETRDGLRTGVKFFEWARSRWPDLPFVVFTNVSAPGLLQQFQPETKCIYIDKQDHQAEELADQVAKLIPVR